MLSKKELKKQIKEKKFNIHVNNCILSDLRKSNTQKNHAYEQLIINEAYLKQYEHDLKIIEAIDLIIDRFKMRQLKEQFKNV